jgi:hypothetical protein
MEFPILTYTRKGTPVELISYDKGSDRPWIGFIIVDLEDVQYRNPMSWMDTGAYYSQEIPRSLDITVPQ